MVEHLKVVPIYETNFRDTVATLRRLADDVEAGKYGEVGTVAVVLLGDRLEVFGMGPGSDTIGEVVALLAAGQLRFVQALANHGRDEG